MKEPLKFNSPFLSIQFAILVGCFMISLSLLHIAGSVRIPGIPTPGAAYSGTPTNAPVAADSEAAPAVEDNAVMAVALKDAPVLGSKDAKVTMVEFSDYECPFCKRYFEDAYPEIVKNYVDTGKLKIVFRNLPLSFHQNAHKEAQAALCARDQGGDAVYWKFHDEIFTRTTANGTGLALDQLPVIANFLGINGSNLTSCLDAGKYKDYVDKDLEDAAALGASGTPTFFIGKSDASGTIQGTKLVGAQPYSAFQTLIDQHLQ